MDTLILALLTIEVGYFFYLLKNKRQRGNFVDVIVIHDVKQPDGLKPNPHALLQLFRYFLDLDQRATFRICSISDRQIINPVEVVICDWNTSAKQNIEKKVDFRTRQIQVFFDDIKRIVLGHLAATATPPSLANSEVFRTINSELNVFKTATEKILVVHSPLRERSDLFGGTDKDIALLFSSAKRIARRFKKAVRIRRLGKIKLVFVYDPVDWVDEKRYLAMVGIFRRLYERKGVNISVQSTAQAYAI